MDSTPIPGLAQNVTPELDRKERFLAALEEHAWILRRISRAYAPNAADREDLVQETIAQLWRSYASFDGRARFSTWMYRVALNVAISRARREDARRRAAPALEGALVEDVAAPAAEPAPAGAEELERALARLGELDKALVLLWLDGVDHASIAETLGLSVSNVSTRLGRLKARLAESVRADMDRPGRNR